METGQHPFADLLKRCRVAVGLTQEELAERADLSTRAIMYLERGARVPYRNTARRLAEALDLSPHEQALFVAAAQTRTPAVPSGVAPCSFSPLPRPSTTLVGREQEIAEIARLLNGAPGQDPPVRLVTLTGLGGIGKTRVAVQVASDLRDTFTQGVCFVSLAELRDPALLPTTVAAALGVQGDGRQPVLDVLLAYLQDRRLLLVLDNFEHLVAAAVQVSALLTAAPRLSVLVTSRTALRLYGEQEFPVPLLAVPDVRQLPPLEILAQSPAVALFVQRARRVAPHFVLDIETASAVAAICVRLDGLPLALELAAARVRLLPPQVLLTRLSRRLAVLINGPRDVPVRQQTLHSTIAWSYDLLEPDEQSLFACLGVFVGGATLEAIEVVCAPEAGLETVWESQTLLDRLESLVAKSLVLQKGQEPRFVLLETVAEYARDRLQALSQSMTVGDRHAAYYRSLAMEGEVQLRGAHQRVWLAHLEADHANLRAAVQWSAEHGQAEQALEIAGALSYFWYMHGHVEEASAQVTALLARPESSARTAARARALYTAGQMAAVRGQAGAARAFYAESVRIARHVGDRRCHGRSLLYLAMLQEESAGMRRRMEESLAILREEGDTWGSAWALDNLAMLDLHQGQVATARTRLDESLGLRRAAGDAHGSAYSYEALALVAQAQQQAPRERRLLQRSLALNRTVGDTINTARVLLALSRVACEDRDHAAAHVFLADSLRLMQAIGLRPGLIACLHAAVLLAVARAQPARALCLGGAAAMLGTASPFLLDPVVDARWRRSIMLARQVVPDDDACAAWTQGEAMTLEEAVAFALEEQEPSDALDV